VVPIELEQRAMEILESPGDPDNARRTINPEQGTAKVIVPLYWNSTTNWALVNQRLMKENCIFYDRRSADYNSIIDFETYQLKASGYMRYSYLAIDWRWLMYGSVS
jgi:hypothetical protein